MTVLLLDTCAALWIVAGEKISKESEHALGHAQRNAYAIAVSAITAWEVGLLVARGRLAMSVAPKVWMQRLLSIEGVELVGLSTDVLIASSSLPGDPPRDPADRIIIATARETGATILTRDQKILDYAVAGHVTALKC